MQQKRHVFCLIEESMIRLFLISLFAACATLNAQSADSVEVEIMTGDTLQIGHPSAADFRHLDMYRKTRWTGGEVPYDTGSGSGFYQSFFASGDFDVAELPAAYEGKLFVVLGVEVLQNKTTGLPMNIMYLRGDLPNSVIWVDFDQAFESGELRLPE